MKSQAPRRSLLAGVSVLTVSALSVKVIGLLYRIPLLDRLGTEGMGYFNTAYELYALFCVISTAGLPVAMSVLISSGRADARRVFRVSLGAFLVIGTVGTLLLWGLSAPFAALLGNPRAAACMRAIAPTVFLICLSSAYRGYFQGAHDMRPTAWSQVIEAAGKLLLGLLFASRARANGCDLPTTAAYAVLGLTVGTALSVAYLAFCKSLARRTTEALPSLDAPNAPAGDPPRLSSTRAILRALGATAVPVTLGAGIISLAKCLDIALIHRRLQAVGLTAAETSALYGCYSTLAVPVFNILPSLATSVALTAVPALAASLGARDEAAAHKTALSSLRMTLAIAIPAALGLSVFAEDVLSLLFAGQPAAVAEATPWLSVLGLSVPAACLVTVTGGMLQAAGRADRPIRSMLVGVAVKVVLAYILLALPDHPLGGMMAAPLSSLLCDTVIVLCNLAHIARHAPALLPTRREGMAILGLPLLLGTAAIAAVLGMRSALGWATVTPLHTLASIAAVLCLYGAGCLLTQLTTRRKST